MIASYVQFQAIAAAASVYTIGAVWDSFTLKTQARAMRDLIALDAECKKRGVEFYVAVTTPDLNPYLKAARISLSETITAPTLWLFYQRNRDTRPAVPRGVRVQTIRMWELTPNVIPLQRGADIPMRNGGTQALRVQNPLPMYFPQHQPSYDNQ